MIGCKQVLSDIEGLKGKRLESLGRGSALEIVNVDYEKQKVFFRALDNNNQEGNRPFHEFETIWNALAKQFLEGGDPWVYVEAVLNGRGSSRNQPETIMANLPYIVYSLRGGELKGNGKGKHIAFIGSDVHEAGSIKRADDKDLVILRKNREDERAKRIGPSPRNWIFFGAPGTGKSHQLDTLSKELFQDENITRVTFYPDYTYSQFVGCYKPIGSHEGCRDESTGKQGLEISYDFVPGPFLETYVKAAQNPDENYLLIVEEINRSNPAAVFGDVFQLLDRDDDGKSIYPVDVPLEMRAYLKKNLIFTHTNDDTTIAKEGNEGFVEGHARLNQATKKLQLPGNMYIWATMNSADQGVFPMDTAFKRRWDFRYMGIDEGEDAEVDGRILSEIEVPCGGRNVLWNSLRHAINEFMLSDNLKINEDKLLGPFFISPSSLTPERFGDVFKDKVLLYLYEDAGKTKHSKMFKKELNTYAKVCTAFDAHGEEIFGAGFNGGLVHGVNDNRDAEDNKE